MAELVKKHGILLVVLAATVMLYTQITVPAIARNRRLAELEQERAIELERLRDEALRKKVLIRAIERGDPAVLERAARGRFVPEPSARQSVDGDR